jgi:hypothetical protein
MIRISLALLFMTVFASCKKDDAFISITYPSVYYKFGVQSIGGLRVFTRNGELKNSSIINRFIDMDTAYFSYVLLDISNQRAIMDTVTFSDARKAVIMDNYTSHQCVSGQAAGMLVLTRLDTSIGYSYHEPITQNITYHLRQVKPEVFSEYISSSVQGFYAFGYTGKEKYVFKQKGERLTAPLVQFINHSNRYNNGYVNTPLKPDFYKHLSKGDTVALQEAEILYQKQ